MPLLSSSERTSGDALARLPHLTHERIERLRAISARQSHVARELQGKLLNSKWIHVTEADLIIHITRPIPIRAELLRSSNRSAPEGGNTHIVGDLYIGMIIPEDIIEAMMILLLRFPQYCPESIRNLDKVKMIELFANPIVRSSQTGKGSDPGFILWRHTITFVNPLSIKEQGDLDVDKMNRLITKINNQFEGHYIQYRGVKGGEGLTSLTGGAAISHNMRGVCIFAPTGIIGPTGAITLQRADNGFEILFGDARKRVYLHTTIGFSGQTVLPAGKGTEPIYVAGDIHESDNPGLDKSTCGEMIPFQRPVRRLPRSQKPRNRGEILDHNTLLTIEGFPLFFSMIQEAKIGSFSEYQEWLSDEKNAKVARRCFQQLHDAGYLTPNLAIDWSVASGRMSESLGFQPNGLWRVRDNHFASGDNKAKILLIKGAGNNQGGMRNQATSGEGGTAKGWTVEGYGDNLYIDMVQVFCRIIRDNSSQLANKHHVCTYIAYNLIQLLRKKYRKDQGNQYGGVDVKPAEMQIDTASLVAIIQTMKQSFRNIQAKRSIIPIDSHGEFEGEIDTEFLGRVGEEMITLKEKDFDGIFRGLTNEKGELNVVNYLMYGCYPFHFTWGDFQALPTIYKDVKIDCGLSKRSTSHQGVADFYQGLMDTVGILNPGGYYITDGMTESYSRVLRLDPRKLETLLNNPELKVWMIIDHSGGAGIIKSLVIYRRSGDTDKDNLFGLYVEEEIVGGLLPLNGENAETNLLDHYCHEILNLNRIYIRDQIGPEKMDRGVHTIISEFSQKYQKCEPTMLVAILVHIATVGILDDMRTERIKNYVTKSVSGAINPALCTRILTEIENMRFRDKDGSAPKKKDTGDSSAGNGRGIKGGNRPD